MTTDAAYSAFLEKKKFRTEDAGFHVDESELPEFLFDYQKACVKWALRKGRAGLFAGTGLGKSGMMTSFAQKIIEKTNGHILLLAPLAVSEQIYEMDRQYGFDDIRVCVSQSDVSKGINITNYEKLHKFDPYKFDGIVLDEASIIKNFNGSTRNQLIDSFRHTKYKLSCSATPSPNAGESGPVEILNQSEFLGIMSRTEALATFFVHDSGNTSEWRLKGHAQDEFWKWVASWALMFNKPSDLGFDDAKFILPPLVYNEVIIPVDLKRRNDESIFGESDLHGIQDRIQVRKETIHVRTQKAAEIVNSSDEMFLVWCDLNDESKIVSSLISDAVEVTGSDSDEHKKKAMLDFAHGRIRVLTSKPKLAGHGMNWQKCHNVVYVGLSDSFEALYQSVRRCYRFGQKEQVNVWLILSDKEVAVLENLKRKEKDAVNMQVQMIKHMEAEMKKQVTGTVRETEEYNPQQVIVLPNWLKTA